MSAKLNIDEIEARANAATPGPWEATTWADVAGVDAEFIAAARTDVPALVARIRQLEDAAKTSYCVYCGLVGPRDHDFIADHVRSCPRRDDALSADLRAHAKKLALMRDASLEVLETYASMVEFGRESVHLSDDEVRKNIEPLLKRLLDSVGDMVEKFAAAAK